MLDIIEVIILAVVQGIAEFLPISSSGHLVILGALMNSTHSQEDASLEIILHAGTLGSILIVFWRRILDLLTSDRRVIPLLVVGTIPAAVVGLTIKKFYPWITKAPLLAGIMLLATGAMLILLGRLQQRDGKYQSMSLLSAFLVGCFQGVAVLPGISRSGSTILGGRLLGLNNEDSVTFSFLLAIPAILGATVLQVKDLYTGASTSSFGYPALAVGAIISFAVGIIALKWLVGWSRQDRLHWFAWWCIPAGFVVISLFSLGFFS